MQQTDRQTDRLQYTRHLAYWYYRRHCYLLTYLLSLQPHDYSRVTWSQPAMPLVVRGMTITTTTIRYVEYNTTHMSHEYANEIWLFSGT